MRLIAVAVAVSLAVVVSANAWPDVNLENSAASNFIFGALGSVDAATPCKCAIPRECTGADSCECLNNAAVSCWVENGQNCRLDLQNCGAPNSPPTSSNSQFPPCLPTTGGNNPLPPCAATATCRKMDSSCYDWNRSSSAGCIGICVPKGLGQRPKQAPPSLPKASPPKSSGPAWQWQPRPSQPAQPAQQPAGPNWGTPVANGPPPPAATPWAPPPGGPAPVQAPPAQAPPAQAPGSFPAPGAASGPPSQAAEAGPQSVGACPANIKCPGNNVCTPDPKARNTFLCIQPLESCAGVASVKCQGNKTCVADPRIQCKGKICTGLCV